MRKGNPFVGFHPELLPKKHQYPTPEEVARADWEGVIPDKQGLEVEQRKAAMKRGESPMYVPLSDLTSEQIRGLQRSAFTNDEWDELDPDDAEWIEDHDDESQERVDELAKIFIDRWKWSQDGDNGQSADEILEYGFEQYLANRSDELYDEMPDSTYRECVAYGENLGHPEATVRRVINEALADNNNYSYETGGYSMRGSVYSEQVINSIYIEFYEWRDELAVCYPDEIERAVDKIRKDTDLNVDADDIVPKRNDRYFTFEINDIETGTYAHAVVDWENIESIVKSNLDDIEIPDDADHPDALPPEERVVHKWPDGFYVQDLLPSELPAEGKAMGMCVGRPDMGYGRAVRNGEIKILSLRRPSGKPLFTFEAILKKGSQSPSKYPDDDDDSIVEIEQIKGKANRKPGFDLGKDRTVYAEQGTHGEVAAINAVLKRDEVKRVLEFVTHTSMGIAPLDVEDLQPAMFAISRLAAAGDKWALEIAQNTPGFEQHDKEVRASVDDAVAERRAAAEEAEQARIHGVSWWVTLENGETVYRRAHTEEELRARIAEEFPGIAIGAVRATNPTPAMCPLGHGAGCTGFCVPYRSKRATRNPPLHDIKVRREKKGWHVDAKYPRYRMNYGPFKNRDRAMRMREAVIESDLQRNPTAAGRRSASRRSR